MRIHSALLALPLCILPLAATACYAEPTPAAAAAVEDTPAAPLRVRKIASDLNQPLFLEVLPDGTDRLMIMERTGALRILDPKTGAISPTPFMDISSTISLRGEGGLLGLAFSPDYKNDGMVYVNVTNKKGDTEIRRYKTSGKDSANPETGDIILKIKQPYSNHNAGWIGFTPSGLLLVPTGDGGSGGDPLEAGQDTQTLLGKILRIDVTGDDFPDDDLRDYAIPKGNTFTDADKGLPEIFTVGLRNPWRASIDSVTGDLFIGDVGQNKLEEIDRLDLSDATVNFGWDTREGTRRFEGKDSPAFTPPIAEYSHGYSERKGKSVTGGYVYNGPIERLKRQYIFGDFISSNIWSIPVDTLKKGQTIASEDFTVLTDELFPDEDDRPNITSFGEDAEGNLYILTIGGDIFIIEAGE